MDLEKTKVKKQLSVCYQLYLEYKLLVDSYVLNFYTDNNWEKLPKSWQRDLKNVEPHTLSKVLNYAEPLLIKQVLPLSLLTLRTLINQYDIPRKQIQLVNSSRNLSEKVEKLLWKHVKLKKKHEITIMAELTYQMARKNECSYIVDIGAGIGHLCRMLAYGYGLKMCGIEAQEALSETAKTQDAQFEYYLRKYPDYVFDIDNLKPIHINMRIEPALQASEFLNTVKTAFNINSNEFNFGLIALHACGDLSATLLRLYESCPNVKFINIVGCCYMKLTTIPDPIQSFPLSFFSKARNCNLTYNSREVACHAIENYIERLDKGNYWELKIHSYRAALEKILQAKWPEHCQSPLANVKYTQDLSFHDYCLKAIRKLGFTIDKDVAESEWVQRDLEKWNRVVIFYTMRLLLAPIVETIILLDRFLFVREISANCSLIPAFDPKLSPRNHILNASRK